jgi:hypothetical protein
MLTELQVYKIVKNLQRIGFKVRPNSNSSHYVVYPPGHDRILTIHSGKSRLLKKKLLSDLARVGIPKEEIQLWKI